MTKKTAGNKKRARGKSSMKDLELPARKAKGVKGGTTLTTSTTSGTTALGAYTPLLVIAKNVT
jgi:hypothetical protein